MKKLFALMLCIVLTLSLVACGGEEAEPTTEAPTTEAPTTEAPTTEAPTTEAPTTEMPTEESSEEEPIEMSIQFDYVTIDAEGMMNPVEPTEDMLFVTSLFEGLESLAYQEIPGAYIVTELTPDLYEGDVFTPYVEGMTAVRCEAAMMGQPHSVVVLNVPEGTDVEAVRADIEANANPSKWVCATADQVTVVANGNTILLVMSNAVLTDAVVNNFNTKLAG